MITKAGYVIYNILNKDIMLPAITIWHNTETGDFNIHDGKQRTLSLYYFLTGYSIVTYRNGKAITNFNALSKADQDKILNYQIVVQYNEGTTDEEKEKVENLVNEWIKQGLDVTIEEMSKEEAVKQGAEHMFIERYPDIVTVYSIGTVSKEICMGPHVKNTSELGTFKIVKEEASSAGVRRIKAILD